MSLLSCVFSRTFLSGGIGAPIFSAFSRILPRVYLKSRNYRLFLQAQPDYALKILGILLVFAKYPSFSLFSDTPPAPSFQSILCKLQPLTRHSVRHLPYNIGMLPCVNLQLIYLKQLCAVAILHRVLPAFCAEHSRNVLEKRTGLSCFPMPLTVGKTHRLPPEQLHFTQGIPAPPAPP